MPYFFTWSGKDRSGQTVIREVQADTSEQSKAILVAEGYTELVLKEDEIMAIARAGFRDDNAFLGEPINVTAEDRLKHRDQPTVSLWDIFKNNIGTYLVWLLIIIAFGAYLVHGKHYLSLALMVLGILFWLAFLVFLGLPSVYYKKLIVAGDWARWDDVLSLVETLKTIGRFTFIKIPDSELARHRAKALVGKGRLSDGLAEYSKCEGRPDCPPWMYKLFVAGFYTVAKQHDKAIEYNLAAIQLNSSSTAWADLAYRYARYQRDPVKAREAEAEADKTPSTDVAKPFRIRCHGVIAYLENDFITARTDLETSIQLVENVKWRPYKDGHLAIARAYLCCVLAKQRDLAGAKKNFDLAKDYLVATKEDELIAECRRLIGNG